MSNFPILDLVAGIIFIFFLLSIICSSIVEMILIFKKVRSEIMEEWLLTIFDTKVLNAQKEQVPLGQLIMNHCAVTALSATDKAPSYIDAKNFVSAVLDKITKYSAVVNPTSISQIIESVNSSTAISEELKRSILIYANEAKDTYESLTVKTTGAIEIFRNKMENWYDSNMDRLTGTLKIKYTRRFTMIAAVVVTLSMNADTIEIMKYLYNSPAARVKLAAKAYETGADDSIKQAMNRITTGIAANDTSKINSMMQLQDSLNAKLATINEARAALVGSIPLGWSSTTFAGNRTPFQWIGFGLSKLIGMAATVIAIMMGAPFWFDVLNKVSNLRGVGKKPAESEKK